MRKEEPRRPFQGGERDDRILAVKLPLEIKSTVDIESSRTTHSVHKCQFQSTPLS